MASAQHAALVTQARTLLETIHPNVENFVTQGAGTYIEWQWRSKGLIDYLVAYDLLRSSGEVPATLAASQAQLQAFAGNLYRQALTPFSFFWMKLTFFGTIKNNHALIRPDDGGGSEHGRRGAERGYQHHGGQQPTSWAGAGFYHIDNVLWRDAKHQSDSTQMAGYAEGPYYCKYALLNCLPLFRALSNFLSNGCQAYTFRADARSIRNPYYNPKYDLLYDWRAALRLPGGGRGARLGPPAGPARRWHPGVSHPHRPRLTGHLPAPVRVKRAGYHHRRRPPPRRRVQLYRARLRPAAGPRCRLP